MTTDAIADVIEAVTAAAGLDDHITSHVLRHTYGIELTRDGVDIVNCSPGSWDTRPWTRRGYTRGRARGRAAAGLLSADD